MTDTARRCKLVILISGRGSNMQAIVDTVREKQLNAQICAVISNKADAAGLYWAQQQGISTRVVSHNDYPSREAFDCALANVVQAFEPDYVLLAGFLRVLTPRFVDQFTNRLLNIHPSLLPLFPGLHTHQQALDAGVQWHGCTVHFVTSILDCGPIVAQGLVPVHYDDTASSLAERLIPIEHQIFARVVQWLAQGRVSVSAQNKVEVDGVPTRAFTAFINE